MKILIIDIETTNFFNRGGKIVEVGIVELDLETGERKILFDHVVHENGLTLKDVNEAWIVQNSDLTVEQIRFSPKFTSIKHIIQQIVDLYPAGATAYNNQFDFQFLEDRGIRFPKKLDCPMILATDVCQIPSYNGIGYKWPKVQEAWDFFFGTETGYIEKHRGADDAFHEALIVYELYKRGIFTA